jgi:glycosyltransferase involved in cell wall biosynthesis
MSTYVPRVSIGLPVYNGEQFLGAALDSLLDQTFEDFELVISDNASTDTTEEICRTYAAKDRRIRYYRNERNLGVARNFNRVFELSTGQYFKWHCYDDLCAPELVERCVEILDQLPSVILCYARTTIIDEHGKTVKPYFEDLNLRSPSPYQRYKHYHRHNHHCLLCCAYYGIIRRSVLEQTHLMLPYIYSEVNLIGELALRGEFYEVPEYLFLRRDHPRISTRVFPTAHERVVLYDPERQGKGVSSHPGWRMFSEQVRSVTRVRMPAYDKARCYLVAARYFAWLARGTLSNIHVGVRQRLNHVPKPNNSGNIDSHHRSAS